jgi:hypothetical protein
MSTYGNTYTHVASGLATTIVKAAPGTLNRVIINQKGASSNLLTLYDNPTAGSGTVIAIIDSTAGVGALVYNCQFKTGLTAVSATGTGADFTIIWS